MNNIDNCNYFCELIPPLNGSWRSGLWQKISDIEQALGPDPCKDLHDSVDSPAGLTNLGATCYTDSMLQCLYIINYFREGDQLTWIFAQLHSSKMVLLVQLHL